MRAVAPPAPATDDLHVPRIVLRDGSTASVRSARPEDATALRVFFHELSPDSRFKRFFTASEPPDALIERFCRTVDPRAGLTLIALRQVADDERVVAAASYFSMGNQTAEVAFAVDDRFQGKGLGTLLLERLAVYAERNGFERFYATTLSDNAAMLEVFRDSGFQIRSKLAGGTTGVQLALTPSSEGVDAAERRRRLATIESLRPMLAPRAIAVVGASRDAAKIGGRILRAVAAACFTGPVYAVRPSGDPIPNVPTVDNARRLPAGVDLAVIAVPAAAVAGVVDDCAAAGVRSIVVVSAGFAEVGPQGRALQDALVEQTRRHGMRMVGPNCMGLITTDDAVRLNASFSPVFPPAGHVAFSSQSGALGIAILELARERHVGLSAFVSVGNKADVSSNDLLEYWEDDPATRVIMLYLESFGNPRRFARVARRVARTKPIIAIKAGRTRAGSRAAGSHTAALAATDTATDALFRHCGVIRAETIDEMFDVAACLDAQPLPRGRRVGIVTNAGGPGILAADACEAAGLTVASFSPETRARVAAALPSTASIGNPVDMVASAGRDEYRQTIASVLASSDVDALLIIHTPVDTRQSPEIVEGIRLGIAEGRVAGGANANEPDKPIVACVMGHALAGAPLAAGRESIPTYAFPENAIRALARIASYAEWRAQPAGLYWGFDDLDNLHLDDARALCQKAIAERGEGWLTTDETAALLRAFGLPVAAGALAHTADEAAALAALFGFPVAAKIASPRLPHKTDLGGVRLNLANEAEVRTAFAELDACLRARVAADAIDGVLIQPMVAGVETLVGIAHDPVFGPLIGFGIGGVDVELLGDVRFRIAPLTDRDADELLREITHARVLHGYRGRPAADVDALREILLRVSWLAEALPEVAELDLNPVMAMQPGKGCRVVDARVRVKS